MKYKDITDRKMKEYKNITHYTVTSYNIKYGDDHSWLNDDSYNLIEEWLKEKEKTEPELKRELREKKIKRILNEN